MVFEEEPSDLKLTVEQASILFLVGVLMIVPEMMLKSWILGSCWIWFIVPLGCPVITYAHCLGLSIVMWMIAAPIGREIPHTFAAAVTAVLLQPLKSLWIYLFAYLVHFWM